ncbi:MAG: VOC family protein [Novosphingobium sp.]
MTSTAISFGFTKLVVADLDRAERFYREVFGMASLHRIVAEDHAFPLEEIVMELPGGKGGHKLLLVHYLTRPCPPPGAVWIGFSVNDLPETLLAVEAQGGRVEVPLHENAEHRVLAAIAADTEGHLIEVIQILG